MSQAPTSPLSSEERKQQKQEQEQQPGSPLTPQTAHLAPASPQRIQGLVGNWSDGALPSPDYLTFAIEGGGEAINSGSKTGTCLMYVSGNKYVTATFTWDLRQQVPGTDDKIHFTNVVSTPLEMTEGFANYFSTDFTFCEQGSITTGNGRKYNKTLLAPPKIQVQPKGEECEKKKEEEGEVKK